MLHRRAVRQNLLPPSQPASICKIEQACTSLPTEYYLFLHFRGTIQISIRHNGHMALEVNSSSELTPSVTVLVPTSRGTFNGARRSDSRSPHVTSLGHVARCPNSHGFTVLCALRGTVSTVNGTLDRLPVHEYSIGQTRAPVVCIATPLEECVAIECGTVQSCLPRNGPRRKPSGSFVGQ